MHFPDKSSHLLSRGQLKLVAVRLSEAEQKGYIEKRIERNPFLLVSYRGVEEMGISAKWNVKIYTYNSKKKGYSVVCVDTLILEKLVEGEYGYFTPPEHAVLSIDDAGWGFPLCGVMVGVTDERRVETAVVPVQYFRHDTDVCFESGKYLKKYTELGLGLVRRFEATPKSHRIEICSGFVNQPLRRKLRKMGYDVRVVEIRGLLQEQLEERFKIHVLERVGKNIYYDPKEMDKSKIPEKYHDCLNFGWKYCPEKIKTGWKSITVY